MDQPASFEVRSAVFVKSAVKPVQYPDERLPEVAFAGRSNVGKSSLINTLARHKKLVRTSSTPGRTQTINFFIVNQSCYFVDLPGYGFAKVPEATRRSWGPMVERYLRRGDVRAVVCILDIRRIPSDEDLELLLFLDHHGINSIITLTKTDKLSSNKVRAQKDAISRVLNREDLIEFSAKTGLGREAVLKRIAESLKGPGQLTGSVEESE
ncbi:MAG: YihA family ribosome biogenesis GTP-binding protein [Deltaproteobacteria bacterium]|nr:YihA family ribosome biogenesis GTP-binding protein [Deltaproteobacteria bacterium]